MVDLAKRPLYRETGFLMANTLLMAGAGFVFWLVAAQLADPATIGLATATIGAIGTIGLFARMGLPVSLIQLLPPVDEQQQRKLVSTAIILVSILSITGSAVFLLGTPIWSPDLTVLSSSLTIVLLFVLLTTFNTIQLIFDAIYIALRQAKWVFGTSIINQAARFAGLVGLAVLIGLEARHIVFSYFGFFIISILLSAFIIFPRFGIRPLSDATFDREWAGEYFQGSVANSAPALLNSVPKTIGIIIVLNRFGAAQSGFYYILWLFGSIALFAPRAFEKTSLVQMVQGMGFTRSEYIRAGIVSLISGFAIVIGGVLFLPLFGNFYARLGFLPLVPFAISTLPALILQVRHSALRSEGAYKLLTASLAGVLLTFLGALALLPSAVGDVGWIWLGSVLVGIPIAHADKLPSEKLRSWGRM